jgi:hypothetical protein
VTDVPQSFTSTSTSFSTNAAVRFWYGMPLAISVDHQKSDTPIFE